MVDHAARLERDAFDPFFDHLILYDDALIHNGDPTVVGVYRLLPQEGAAKIGRYYSEDEYDLTPFVNRDGVFWNWGDPVCMRIIAVARRCMFCGRPWQIT